MDLTPQSDIVDRGLQVVTFTFKWFILPIRYN